MINSTILFLFRYAIIPTGTTTNRTMITRPPKNDRPVKVGILVDTGIDCCVEFTSVPSAVAISRSQQRIGPRAIYVIALPTRYEISTQTESIVKILSQLTL